jgi:hypothetical protein
MAAILYQGSVEKKRFSRIFSGFFQLGTKKKPEKTAFSGRMSPLIQVLPGLDRGRTQSCNCALVFAAAQLIEISLKQ